MALEMLNAVLGFMGTDLNRFVDQALEAYRWKQDVEDMLIREQRRLQIRKFNKRKAQRRAYAGRKRK